MKCFKLAAQPIVFQNQNHVGEPLGSWEWTSLGQRKGLQQPPPPKVTTNLWGAKHFLGVKSPRDCHRLVLHLFEFLLRKSRKVFWHWARFLRGMHTEYLSAQQNTISLYLRVSHLLTTIFLIATRSDGFSLTQCPSSSLHSAEEFLWLLQHSTVTVQCFPGFHIHLLIARFIEENFMVISWHPIHAKQQNVSILTLEWLEKCCFNWERKVRRQAERMRSWAPPLTTMNCQSGVRLMDLGTTLVYTGVPR